MATPFPSDVFYAPTNRSFLYLFLSFFVSFAEILTLQSMIIETDLNGIELPEEKEVVSYQRYGRFDTKLVQNPFRCHLCGFSCRFKENLLKHFHVAHPNWERTIVAMDQFNYFLREKDEGETFIHLQCTVTFHFSSQKIPSEFETFKTSKLNGPNPFHPFRKTVNRIQSVNKPIPIVKAM